MDREKEPTVEELSANLLKAHEELKTAIDDERETSRAETAARNRSNEARKRYEFANKALQDALVKSVGKN